MDYSVEDISDILEIEPKGDYRGTVSLFSNDVMNVVAPEGTLFFAAGMSAYQEVLPLYDVGVRMFVVEEWNVQYDALKDAIFWPVRSVCEALELLAEVSRKRYRGKVAAVSGGSQKKIVKELLYQAMQQKISVFKSLNSIDNINDLPLSMVMLPKKAEMALIDIDIARKDDMEEVRKIVRPDFGIYTDENRYDESISEKSKERIMNRLELFADCPYVIYRKDPVVDRLLKENFPGVKQVSWGGKDAEIFVGCSEENNSKGTVQIRYKNVSLELDVPFSDSRIMEGLFDVIAFMLYNGADGRYIMDMMPLLSIPPRRLEIKSGNQNIVLIQDYSNSDLFSLSTSLQSLMAQSENRKRCVILSDFVHVKGDLRLFYETAAWQLKRARISFMVGIGKQMYDFKDIFDVPGMFYSTTEEFLKELPKLSFHDSAILIKGDKGFNFENISQTLQKQLHVTSLEVNLDAMKRNLEYFKSCTSKDTKFSVMVKAFTYGCGGYEIASALQECGVYYLMVAYVDEGVELRKGGITTNIGVMTPEPECFDNMIEHKLEPGIYSIDLLYELEEALEKHGVTEYPVHIKLNTGMNRSGLDPKDLPKLFRFFEGGRRRCYIRSIFSHLAGADEKIHDEFTREQLALFESMSSEIQGKFKHKIFRHILNSAGIERFPEYHYDMVRLGIGIHGISVNGVPLELISSFKTHIVSLRDIDRYATVGYGRYGALNRNSRIAVIPVGYADGLDRRLGRKNGCVFVDGCRVPIIGNICMDACMIDVTDCPEVKVGDAVEIFGNNIKLTEIADKLGTIPYEVITGISRRVLRVFYNE